MTQRELLEEKCWANFRDDETEVVEKPDYNVVDRLYAIEVLQGKIEELQELLEEYHTKGNAEEKRYWEECSSLRERIALSATVLEEDYQDAWDDYCKTDDEF